MAMFPGVWATFTGPAPQAARLWAALLYCGEGAVVAGRSALRLSRALEGSVSLVRPGAVGAPFEGCAVEPVQIAVPHDRRVRRQPGLRVVRRRDLDRLTVGTTQPPRIRLEDSVLDVAEESVRRSEVIGLVTEVLQARATTPARLRAALASRPRHRWRRLLSDVLADVESGVQSPLERHYLHRVARAHGLPRARHNHRERDARGRVVYRDADYEEWGLIVELDGGLAHRASAAFRDRRRDNSAALSGRLTLRYGWHEVTEDACAVAAEVADGLRRGGWDGVARRCGPSCTFPQD
jgi:hypothetical protein